MGMGERGQAEFFATAKNERLTDDQQTIRKYCKLQKTGRSIVVVHKAGGLVARVQFSAARLNEGEGGAESVDEAQHQ